MARLAFVSPLPPAPTGIADYSADVLAWLAPRHELDVFHGQEEIDRGRLPAGCGVHPAAELLARNHERPYDLAVYQMGNGPAHGFLYPLLPRLPGLLVLHDLVLHHARARQFLDSEAARAYGREPWSATRQAAAREALQGYVDELAYTYPGQGERILQAQLNTVGDLLPYAYPLFRLPVEAARLTAVHNAFMAAAVADEVPGAPVARIPMAVPAAAVAPADVAALRARLGFAPDDFVVASFGLLTREKRVETVARAVARASALVPRIRLLLVGPVPDAAALDRLLGRLGVAERAVVTGRVPLETLPAHIEAADLVVHLRYPTARETSAALLRVLAQGRPAVVSDLEHLDELPDDAVVRADVSDEEGAVTRALLHLAARADARERLGARARAFVMREHSAAACLAGYERAIATALRSPLPPPRPWPDHWARAAASTSPSPD